MPGFTNYYCARSVRTGRVLGDGAALHPVVHRALKLLSEGDCERDLGELAKTCGASAAHLSRTFHRQIGVPLSRYRNSLRLARVWSNASSRRFRQLRAILQGFRQTYGRGPRLAYDKITGPKSKDPNKAPLFNMRLSEFDSRQSSHSHFEH